MAKIYSEKLTLTASMLFKDSGDIAGIPHLFDSELADTIEQVVQQLVNEKMTGQLAGLNAIVEVEHNGN
jgi:hypothetical protein